jgi:hypothetical protein
VQIEESTVSVILNCANGDMRKAVTLLQSAHQINPSGSGPVSPELVVDIAGKVRNLVADNFFLCLMSLSSFCIGTCGYNERAMAVHATGMRLRHHAE